MTKISLPGETWPNLPKGSGNPGHCYTVPDIPPEGEYVQERVQNMDNQGIPENVLMFRPQPTRVKCGDRYVCID